MPNPYIDKLLQDGIATAKASKTGQSTDGAPQAVLKKRARQTLLQVIEQDETNIKAWLWLSTVVDSVEDQITCIENVLALDPENETAQKGLALLQEKSGIDSSDKEPDAAAPTHDHHTATKHDPRCPFCRRRISRMDTTCPHCDVPLVMQCPSCNILMDVEWDTCTQCGQTMGDYRLGSVYFTLLASEYQKHHRLSRALDSLRVAEKIDPDQPDLYRQMGEVLAELSEPVAALAMLKKAVIKEPEQIGPYMSLGKVLQQEGQWEQAEEIYREAKAKVPDSSEPYFSLGSLYLQQNRVREARKHLKRATKMDPDHGKAWARLGELYEQTKSQRAAGHAYQQAAGLLPRDSIAWQRVRERLQIYNPQLPANLARSWTELLRQMIGPVLVILVAVLFDSGLRPWWINWSGVLAILMAVLGTFLWVSAQSLPQNPLIRLLTHPENGLKNIENRWLIAGTGIFLWLLALGIILLPIGQSFPQPPS